MFTPTVANSTSYFYALGNTPAINLAKNLPNGVDASLLLLGCGDVRNIIYTAYNEIGLRKCCIGLAENKSTRLTRH